jgi:glycosyltransferase involved in cell wall biosynthesis
LNQNLRIGFIGTISEHKGVDLLVDAFQMLPSELPAVLHIYGNTEQFPDYTTKLMGHVRKDYLTNGRIKFLGTFPNSELGKVFTEIDILVVPSRWYENTPLVMQSALAAKTPLIATNLGGMSELIEHNKNGLLFELNNVDSLHKQLLRLFSEPNLLQNLISGIAPERTIVEMVNDIENVYGAVSTGKEVACCKTNTG